MDDLKLAINVNLIKVYSKNITNQIRCKKQSNQRKRDDNYVENNATVMILIFELNSFPI